MATGTSSVSGLPEGYSLEGQQATSAAPQQAGGLPEGYTIEKDNNQASQSTGSVTNDVGNNVIVPKDGESFADTMKRAADAGKTVTQEQIDKELATAPGKAATVLGAAPAIGAGLPAIEALAPEAGPALKHILTEYGKPALDAINAASKAHPIVAGLLKYGLETAGGLKMAQYMNLFSGKK